MSENLQTPYFIQKGNVYAVPALHYNMETAGQVLKAFEALEPDCVAVELAENMSLQLMHGASRLPDISVISAYTEDKQPLYYLCEPCDPIFEALRRSLEKGIRAFCIDRDVDDYPLFFDRFPDPYAIQKIGLKEYYRLYLRSQQGAKKIENPLDRQRELYMAKRLKELSFSYDRILFVAGMTHIEGVLQAIDRETFPEMNHAPRDLIEINTLSEHSSREAMSEYGWISMHYEKFRSEFLEEKSSTFPPDRQQAIYKLYKQSAENYSKKTGNSFAGYNMRNIMKFAHNYALVTEHLIPDLFQILTSARSCVDHNYAYETWELATEYPYRKNVDNLPELDLTVEELWGTGKKIKFHLKLPSRKDLSFKKRPDKSKFKFFPPGSFGVCSYPPEDISIERFGDFLKKKGTQILTEESARTAPFTASIEDGIDTRETIRHLYEKKLYVKIKGKPAGAASSVVVIFDEDYSEENTRNVEKYPWKLIWHGEHAQESDMAFYATAPGANIVGPGIGRCEYGGFMLSSPPRRMLDIWHDPDYSACRTKAEVLLMAAIDYSVKPIVVYVAPKPPRSFIKSFAARYGKKVVYIPITQLSPLLLNKIRIVHVLDGYDKRKIADNYIF